MEIGPQHGLWTDMLTTGDDCGILSPRDHGKSMSISRAYPIWKAKYDPWVWEILLLGADQSGATENLEKLKEMVAKTESLAYLIPPDRAKFFNSRTEIKFSNGVVIRARSYSKALRGKHPQLIICDDMLNEKNSSTKINRNALKKRFFEVIYPMKDRGQAIQRSLGYKPQLVVIGTPQDDDDLYTDLEKNPGFLTLRLDAIVDEKAQKTLWPSRYDWDALVKIKKNIGLVSFMKEYRLRPMNDETAIFPPSLVQSLFDPTLSYVDNYEGRFCVYLGADFSVPGDGAGDYTCILVMEYDPEQHIYTVLNYFLDRPPTVKEQLFAVVDFATRYKVTLGFLEDNLFQRIYAESLKFSNLPLQGHTVTHSGKLSSSSGILSFRPLFENGRFRLPYKTQADKAKSDRIVLEFAGVRKKGSGLGNDTFHDDTVMALWHAYSASRAEVFEADF